MYLPWGLGRRRGKVGEREVGVVVRLLARWTRRWRVMPFQVPWRETPSEVAPRQKRVFSFSARGGSGCSSVGL